MLVVRVYILCLWWGGLCAVGLYGFLRIWGFLIIGSLLFIEKISGSLTQLMFGVSGSIG